MLSSLNTPGRVSQKVARPLAALCLPKYQQNIKRRKRAWPHMEKREKGYTAQEQWPIRPPQMQTAAVKKGSRAGGQVAEHIGAKETTGNSGWGCAGEGKDHAATQAKVNVVARLLTATQHRTTRTTESNQVYNNLKDNVTLSGNIHSSAQGRALGQGPCQGRRSDTKSKIKGRPRTVAPIQQDGG